MDVEREEPGNGRRPLRREYTRAEKQPVVVQASKPTVVRSSCREVVGYSLVLQVGSMRSVDMGLVELRARPVGDEGVHLANRPKCA